MAIRSIGLCTLCLSLEAPLFAVSKVANQRKEEKRAADEEQKAKSANKAVAEEDFYGPALPPDFGMSIRVARKPVDRMSLLTLGCLYLYLGPAVTSNLEEVISSKNKATTREDIDFVERKVRQL